jgi:hypothetical protein
VVAARANEEAARVEGEVARVAKGCAGRWRGGAAWASRLHGTWAARAEEAARAVVAARANAEAARVEGEVARVR